MKKFYIIFIFCVLFLIPNFVHASTSFIVDWVTWANWYWPKICGPKNKLNYKAVINLKII